MTEEEELKIQKGLLISIRILKDDLKESIEKLEYASFPIISTICSGIDFMGGLICGFNHSSKLRSIKFINEFLSKTNIIYSTKRFAEFFYEYVRCSIIHQVLAPGVLHGINKLPEKHLNIIVFDDFKVLFIHLDELRTEFNKAMDILIETMNKHSEFRTTVLSNYKSLYDFNEKYQSENFDKLEIPSISINNMTLDELDKMRTL